MKKVLSVIVFLFIIIVPLVADYVDVSTATSWSRVDSHKIIVYSGSRAICLIEVRFAFIYSTSKIQFIKTYIGPYDKILIDDEVYDISKVERL